MHLCKQAIRSYGGANRVYSLDMRRAQRLYGSITDSSGRLVQNFHRKRRFTPRPSFKKKRTHTLRTQPRAKPCQQKVPLDKCPGVLSTQHSLSLSALLTSHRLIACWASTGYASATCSGVEQALRTCMDGPPPPKPKPNNINYHLSRFKNLLEGPSKKKQGKGK